MRKIITTICLALIGLLSTLTANADKVVVVPLFDSGPQISTKLLFATIQTWNGNLGGLAGADAKCNSEAILRGFSGTFQALLGSSSDFPLRRSAHSNSRYVSTSNALLKSDFHDMFSSSGLDNIVLATRQAWTGLNPNGSPSLHHCLDWTYSGADHSGWIGATDSVGDDGWIDQEGLQCDEQLSLYCLEQ